MTTDIPADVRLDETLEQAIKTEEEIVRLRDELAAMVAHVERLNVFFTDEIPWVPQLGDTPVDSAMRAMRAQQATIQRLRADGERIATALRDEAEQREWCDEYEQFVNRVNGNLHELNLVPCRRTYDVELRIYANVKCTEDDLEDERQVLRGAVLRLVQDSDNVVSVAVGVE